ncbi:MAG: hypothetical protein MUF19_02650 [Candidatus Pacebacteria bacterium]|jgi:hypothetical protein|nr:hypothetical protein [Candidatus Paceibacterota bacterium]
MRYILEIYFPNSTTDVLVEFESLSPFISMSKGDLLNPAFFSNYTRNPENILRIVNVEHIIWKHEGDEFVSQKTLIFTREEINKSDVRLY